MILSDEDHASVKEAYEKLKGQGTADLVAVTQQGLECKEGKGLDKLFGEVEIINDCECPHDSVFVMSRGQWEGILRKRRETDERASR